MPNKKKILLVVEDEKTLRSIMRDKFIKEGFDVLEASNGQEGLDLFIKESPNLILLDIVMPVMDGMEMLKKLREHEDGDHVPVIILTNLSEAEKTSEAIEQGVNDYWVKTDWRLDDVVKKVKERLGM